MNDTAAPFVVIDMNPPFERPDAAATRARAVSEEQRFWQDLRARHRSVCRTVDATFANCPTAEVTVLRAVASEYAEYLMAWQATSLDLMAPIPPRSLSTGALRGLVAHGDAIRRTVQTADADQPATATPSTSAPSTPASSTPASSTPAPSTPAASTPAASTTPAPATSLAAGASAIPAEVEQEAARLVGEVRDLSRRLDPGQPAERRARSALVESWGRYDDHLLALRHRPPGPVDLDVVQGLHDELVRRVELARQLLVLRAP